MLRALEKHSKWVRLLPIGNTAKGGDMYVFLVSKPRAFTPESARTAKPVIFTPNGIHAGEIAGKDASLMLLRDVLIARKFESWLDLVITSRESDKDVYPVVRVLNRFE